MPGPLDQKTFDLSVKNPNGGEEITHRSPEAIINEINGAGRRKRKGLEKIKALL